MPIYVIDGVKVVVERNFKNDGDSICDKIVNFIFERYLEERKTEEIPKKGD